MKVRRVAGLLALVWIAGEVLLVIFSCGCGRKLRLGRRAVAEQVLTQVTLGIEAYEKAWGAYPPGDGSGAPELRRGLHCGFTRGEDFAEPLAWDLRYRRHPPCAMPPYDLWIVEAEGVEIRPGGQP